MVIFCIYLGKPGTADCWRCSDIQI